MKTIYLIRHGETDLNKQGIVQGSGIDTDLNDTGRMQANLFYTMYKDVPFDKVYTSTLKRAQQTVQKFIDAGIPWQQLNGLNEMGWGDYEGALPTLEVKEIFAEVIHEWSIGNLEERLSGGESPLEVNERQIVALNQILSHTDERNILICMHGRAMRMFLCLLTGMPLSEMDHFTHQNLSLYKLSYENGSFTLIEFNNVMHLRQDQAAI